MTTIKHAGVPVAVVPASSTRDMDEEIAYFRADGVTEESDIFDKVLDAAPSEPGADLVELIANLWMALRTLDDMKASGTWDAATLDRLVEIIGSPARAALAKWEISDAG